MHFSSHLAVLAALASSVFAAALPTELSPRSNTNTEDVIDDADPRLIYTGDWTHLKNQGNSVANAGTLSFSKTSQASVSIPYGTNHTGFYMFMGTKADRGQFSIFLDDLWYSASAEGSCTSNCDAAGNGMMINFPRLLAKSDQSRLIIQNDSPGYLAFDSISLHKKL
ncbi:hypothetical protein JCM3775_004143 [Rhodotorula graminis]|uniref:Uncharacterized protein n=1 Tax=Rhodotorula graminis (strain WP1) TaxID=578459 RepID=A0A0P9EGT9_RHOGW|nr:uncharacterized protein RHOBADRAFT_55627 [Rhodotorula graminis WP1]KPV72522.1 hypothetical protein RHOBADRAFT_55627 [Rhodotorula graminis WP1]